MKNYPPNDNEFTEYVLEKVEGNRERGWFVTFDGAMGFGIPGDSPVEPTVGMTMRQYGKGFGYIVRGCFLDGACVFYRTEEEQQEKNTADNEAADQRRRDDFEKNKADLDRRYDALPPIFRARLDKFRRNNPDFRWNFEPYEMFTCEEAVKIAALGTAENVRHFHAAPWEAQCKMVPTLSHDHSGNTFGMACRLALDYLEHPENVEARHGALAPLVGSKEYGCVPREPATGATP